MYCIEILGISVVSTDMYRIVWDQTVSRPSSNWCWADTGQNQAWISIFVADTKPMLARLLIAHRPLLFCLVPAQHWADGGMPSFRETDDSPILARCQLITMPWWTVAIYDASIMPVWCWAQWHQHCHHQPVSAQHFNVYRGCTWISLGPVQPKSFSTHQPDPRSEFDHWPLSVAFVENNVATGTQ